MQKSFSLLMSDPSGIDEKTRGQKSRATVPLNNLIPCQNVIIYISQIYTSLQIQSNIKSAKLAL
jgi:hypothetical protein